MNQRSEEESEWRGNVSVQDVQPGDVMLIRLRAPGAMHAALVDEIRRNADGTISGNAFPNGTGAQ